MRTALVRLGSVVLALLVLAACGGPAVGPTSTADPDAPPVRFALISIQNPGIDLLEQYEAGAQAAAAAINAEGGFGGREVVIDTCNSQLDTSVAITCAHQTLADEPVAMFGCEVQWSATGLAIYAEAGVPSFNCMNTPEDFTHEWSFGLAPGAFGQHRAIANYLCTRDDVHSVVTFAHDFPQQRRDVPAAVAPVLEGCGKQVRHDWYPASAEDLTPYVAGVVDAEPDFVLTQVGGPQAVQLLTAFQQAGYPADRISVPSNAASFAQFEAAGSAMEGVYTPYEVTSWTETEDPEVAAYLAAMEGAEVDARHPMPMFGYASVMWFRTLAEQIGFDTFDAASLAEFMQTADGVDLVLSRELTNPGPAEFPQVKQGYAQILQWREGRLDPVEVEGADGAWVSGFEPLAAAD